MTTPLGKGGLARVLLVQTDVMKEGKELNVVLKCVFGPALEDPCKGRNNGSL